MSSVVTDILAPNMLLRSLPDPAADLTTKGAALTYEQEDKNFIALKDAIKQLEINGGLAWWDPSAVYDANDKVLFSDGSMTALYVALAPAAAGQSPTANGTLWMPVGQITYYDNAVAYNAYRIVIYNGALYACTSPTTAGTLPTVTANWDKIGGTAWGSITGSLSSQTDLATALAAKEATANKDATGGYVGLTLFKINFKNVLNTITSFFTNSNTAARTYTFPDASGTVALTSDVTSGDSATLASAEAYADGLVVGLWDDRGNFDASGGAYPTTGGSGAAGAIKKGDTWRVSVAGTLPTAKAVEIGDTLRALVDTPGNTESNWGILQNNILYVPVNKAGDAMSGAFNEAKGTDIASAATVNIGAATGNLVHITGTTTITAFDTVQAGTERTVVFDGALTVTNNANILLPTGANINVAANDSMILRSEGAGVWKCINYQPASGYLPLSGGAMTGGINMGATKVSNMSDPSSAQDADTKAARDAAVLLGGETVTQATTDATPTTVSSKAINTSACAIWHVRVTGTKTDGSASAGYERTAVFRNNAGTVFLVGAVNQITTVEDAACGPCDVAYNISGTSVRFQVTGLPATNMNWKIVSNFHQF